MSNQRIFAAGEPFSLRLGVDSDSGVVVMMRSMLGRLAFGLALLASIRLGQAEVAVPAVFSDRAVLQRGKEIPVWGWAKAGEEVSVRLGDGAAQATADEKGCWEVRLALENAPAISQELVIEGSNRLVIRDVLVGEVWLGSGQSNMEFPLSRTVHAAEELARPADPELRFFTVKHRTSLQPENQVEGEWVVATPETIATVSGVGYHFARKLRDELKQPVGVVLSTWGGTPSESWTSLEGLQKDSVLGAAAERQIAMYREDLKQLAAYENAYRAWFEQHGRKDTGPTEAFGQAAAAAGDATGWQRVTLPGVLQGSPFPPAGAVWLRRNLNLSQPRAGRIILGAPRGCETVYINGRRIGGTPSDSPPESGAERAHPVPPGLLREGDNVVVLRLFNPIGPAGIVARPSDFRLGKVGLDGEWWAKVETALPELGAQAREQLPEAPKRPVDAQDVPAALFNGMIHPLVPYGLRGVIWYQGEANVRRAQEYRTAFSLLIQDWRERWGQGDFPFLFCQLANYRDKGAQPGVESSWAELREAQDQVLALPNTGQAVLIDVGEAKDIHPRNKRDAGLRLAALALRQTYERDVAAIGPRLDRAELVRSEVRLHFTGVTRGLVAASLPSAYTIRSENNLTKPLQRNSPESPLEGFALCGPDGKWVWAQARIDGDAVVVWSPSIAVPAAVRYGWADNPTVNLYDGAGFPAAPFRIKLPALEAGSRTAGGL